MKYRYLSKSGLLVSWVCLGTMAFGNTGWGCDAQGAREITRVFIDAGGTFFDTADIYSGETSEEILGSVLKDHP